MFQRFSRVRAQLKQAPDKAQLAKQVETLQAKIDGMQERVEQFELEARKLEDKIFEINQPSPRRYALQRVLVEDSN